MTDQPTTVDRLLQTLALAFPIMFSIAVTLWSLSVGEPTAAASVV